MLQNYLKIALRSLRANLMYTAINVGGLSVGVAACLLMLLYVHHEYSFDAFHQDAERVYRIIGNVKVSQSEHITTQALPAKMADELRLAFPNDIESSARFEDGKTAFVRKGSTVFCEEKRIAHADSGFLTMFHFPVLAGRADALSEPSNIVLTASAAQKYFGKTDVVGETLSVKMEKFGNPLEDEFTDYRIGAVVEDFPSNTFAQADFIIPLESVLQKERKVYPEAVLWNSVYAQTFLKVRGSASGADTVLPKVVRAMEEKARHIANSYTDKNSHLYDTETFRLQPLTDIHLNTLGMAENVRREVAETYRSGNVQQLLILSAIAVVMLFVGCINYINMQTARASTRSREIGVRKTLGARRSHIIGQFFIETILFTFAALVLALALVELSLPQFNALLGLRLSLVMVAASSPYFFVGVIAALFGVLVLLCGLYPALYLSRFSPMTVLRTHLPFLSSSSPIRSIFSANVFRKLLVMAQFSVSIVLMIGIIVMAQQLWFIRAKNLGFDKEHLVMVKLRSNTVGKNAEPLQSAFKQVRGVAAVGSCTSKLSQDVSGYFLPTKSPQDKISIQWEMYIDEEYLAAMGLHLTKGRWITNKPTENIRKIVVNQAFVRRWNLKEPIGTVKAGREIIGVVDDFHFNSVHEPIEPIMFRSAFEENGAGGIVGEIPFQYLAVRLAAGSDYSRTLAEMERVWNGVAAEMDKGSSLGGLPFEYTFLEDDLNALYRKEQRMLAFVGVFGGLTLLIACLGLLSLTAFTVERRTKEIGIRKVLGATVANIIALLSKDFLKLVVIAILIASPLAYWLAGKWLQDFAYRVELGVGVFAISASMALLIALGTVTAQSWRAAKANPVHSLRSE
ncbi:MAG: ABC transporter permease [Ignavibacteria bacterium]|nr:ABC transporter permease [Ignavibacteria bacterium]